MEELEPEEHKHSVLRDKACYVEAWACGPDLRKQRQEEQKSQVVLPSTASLRPTWAL